MRGPTFRRSSHGSEEGQSPRSARSSRRGTQPAIPKPPHRGAKTAPIGEKAGREQSGQQDRAWPGNKVERPFVTGGRRAHGGPLFAAPSAAASGASASVAERLC